MKVINVLNFRSLGDLERTGYPASSMLAEALLNTFHGKYFYFGFKYNGSGKLEEKYFLKDVLKSEESLCNSQLDCTSNFENFHTLAYQMLTCSDAVFASVTDHMRLFVKHLRNHTQSKPLQTPEQNQTQDETQSIKNISRRTNYSSTSYSYVSFGEDVDSLRFSFETSENKDCSFKETERSGKDKSNTSFNSHCVIDRQEKNRSFSASSIEIIDKETFLASETTVDELPRCVTFDTVYEDEESCFPSVAIWSKSGNILQSRVQKCVKNGSFVPFVTSFNHENFHSDISVVQRLNFDDLNESSTSNTSKKIDDELVRRKQLTSQKSLVYKMSHTRSTFGLNDLTSQNHHEQKPRYNYNNEDEGMPRSTVENRFDNEEGIIKNLIKPYDDLSEQIVDICEKRLPPIPDGKIIDELIMPESEDLNAFFESQFEGIEFTQDSDSGDHRSKVHSEDAGITDRSKADAHVDKINMNSEEANAENDIYQGTCNIIDEKSALVKEVDKHNSLIGTNSGIEDIDEYKGFLDSFEECQIDTERLDTEKIHISPNKGTVQGECSEPDKVVDGAENKNEHAISDFKNTKEGKDCNVISEINEETVDGLENDLEEEKEIIESGTNDVKLNDREIIVWSDSVHDYQEAKIKKMSSILVVGKNFLKINNVDKDVEADKVEAEVSELVERDNVTDNISGDHDNFSYESSDLDKFFADISNERNDHEMGSKDIKHEENSYVRNKQMLNEVKDIKTRNGKKTEDFESDLEKFFHDLSQLSLMGSQNSSVKKYHEEIDGNNESRTNYNVGSASLKRIKKNDTVLQDIPYDNSHGNDISDNIIDISTDFKERKLKISMFKPLCGLTPASNILHEQKKFSEKSVVDKVIKADSLNKEVTISEIALRTNSVESIIMQNINANTAEAFKKIRDNGEISEESEKGKISRDESVCINYSADLFEMSGESYEQSSVCILTVSTPSFSTKSDSENASLNECLFEDSPIGTSTPGLDECVILDSQDMSCIYDSEREKDYEDQERGKRRVTFDKRLRRVSTCHVMDMRMRLNESPLTTPVIAGKPCIKTKQNFLKIVPELSAAQEPKAKCENTKLDADGTKDNLGVHVEPDGIGEQNFSECLDGSSDLFSGSFMSTRSPFSTEFNVSYPKKSGTVHRQTVQVQNVNVENVKEDAKNVKDDGSKYMIENLHDSQNHSLNESTDLFIYDAVSDDVHDKSDKKMSNLETRNPCAYTKYKESIDLQNLEQAIMPDLFTCPCINNGFPLKEKPGGNKLQCFSLQGSKLNCSGKIEKCTERMPLKCLALNTPDCVSLSVSKHKPGLLKSENHCTENKENRVILDDMKENIYANISPDIFENSLVEENVKVSCVTADFDKNSVLCKKLFF